MVQPVDDSPTIPPPDPQPLLKAALLLSLCLNGRKALWVGNALHQMLRGACERELQGYRASGGDEASEGGRARRRLSVGGGVVGIGESGGS